MPEVRRVRVISTGLVRDISASTSAEDLEISIPNEVGIDSVLHNLREFEFEEEAVFPAFFDDFDAAAESLNEIFIPKKIHKKEELMNELYILFEKINYMKARAGGEYKSFLTRMSDNLLTLVSKETIDNIDNFVRQQNTQPSSSLSSILNRNEATVENWQKLLIVEFESINEVYDNFSGSITSAKKHSNKSYTNKLIVNTYVNGLSRRTPDKPKDGVIIATFKAIVRSLS